MARQLSEGMGQAVAERTVLRKIDGKLETWTDAATRVAAGNVDLAPGGLLNNIEEFAGLANHIDNGRILMSGRHLQHGDLNQKHRNMEVFTNCATACTSNLSFYNLLNGAGVGGCYDDDMRVVDWDKAPGLLLYLDTTHPDWYEMEGGGYSFLAADSWKLTGTPTKEYIHHTVTDSREGWAKALELYETMTYLGQSDKVLVLDFSEVRPSGQPIGGMQGRPSCGPVPTMQAFKNVRDNVVGKGWPKWKQAMYIDHYFADSVLVGGARRAARIAVKYWQDPDILEFISIKKGGGLWSANNSVGVDEEFWNGVEDRANPLDDGTAWDIFNAITHASYHDGTGEPGFLNLHKLNTNEEGLDWEELKKGKYVGSKKYQVEEDTKQLLGDIAGRVKHKQHKFIVNPCGEIVLSVLGGFCVIADAVPYHCAVSPSESFPNHIDPMVSVVRSLVRVNTMDSIYKGEVLRTNRIGVGLTGIHEWLWEAFGIGFIEAVNNPEHRCWEFIGVIRRRCEREAEIYSAQLGLTPPHTVSTMKPAGTTSKLFGLTEAAHLPAMAYYLRWVQFRNDDPLVQDYADRGYPTKVLTTYEGMTAIGFPTKPTITDLIPPDKLVTAGEASMEDQFKWLQLLEENWLGPDKGNQLSYTLKYDPEVTSYEMFQEMMLKWVPQVRCVSVMPQVDSTAYEYQPEEPISKEEYERYMSNISITTEDIGLEHVECGAGGCPIDFTEGDK